MTTKMPAIAFPITGQIGLDDGDIDLYGSLQNALPYVAVSAPIAYPAIAAT